jgi:uncharacterized protein involved in response to NO
VPAALAAAIDLAFLPALIVTLARPLIASKNRRNLVMLAVLSVLLATNVAMHLDALGLAHGWRRTGAWIAIDVLVLLISVIAGRVFPSFTRNATGESSIRNLPKLDAVAIASLVAVILVDAFRARPEVVAPVLLVAAVAAIARAVHWGTVHARRKPLLWILHAGYAWIPIGLALRAWSALDPTVPSSPALHALTLGAIGSLTLGMMARVTLGHTGRMLAASRTTALAFALVSIGAIVRVLGPLLAPSLYMPSIVVSGLAWTGAFALYLRVHAPMLVAPRVDGKPG